jgi:hypothetical protein
MSAASQRRQAGTSTLQGRTREVEGGGVLLAVVAQALGDDGVSEEEL